MPRKRSESSDRSLSDSDRRKRSKHKRDKRHARQSESESSSSERYHHSHHKRSAKHRKVSKEPPKRESVRDEPSKKQVQRKRKNESSSTKEQQQQQERKTKDESVTEDTIAQAGDISLSIAETNKLREKLGLKPLETDDDAANKLKTTEVHAPPKNIGDIEHSEKIREKIATVKEKRLLEEKLSAVHPVAGNENEDADLPTSEWIKQFEEKLAERKMKEEQQKLLEEAGGEPLPDNVINAEAQKELSQRYDSAHLKGLRVEHSQDQIKEGRPVILTLKDSEILKDEEDVLVNVNIVDDSQAKRNALLRQKKFNEQRDEETLEKSLLSKYDEEIHGRKVESFVLGDEGKFDPEEEKARQLAHEKLTSSAISLDTIVKPIYDYSEPKIIEPVPFRKPRRKKVQRRKVLKADELLAIAGDEGSASDLGNRKTRMEVELPEDDIDDSPIPGDVLPTDDVLLEDLNDVDLKIASERKPKLTAELVARKLSQKREAFLIKEEPLDSPMVIDSMSEFCRTLGDIPVISAAQPTEAAENEVKQEADSETEEDELLERELASSNYGQNSDNVILDEEPVISTGLSSAVKLAKIKGYLEMQKTRQDARLTTQKISALHYTIEDRSHYDIDDKFSRKERYSGPVTEFREKSNYRPTVALEYLGDDGRKMSMKEAFRYLSHRFHGKGSGKRKTEKRMMKIKEEEAMKHMSSVDTPLHTASMLLDKQKELKQPYITLSASKKDPAQLLRKI